MAAQTADTHFCDDETLKLAQRAFEGACWTLGMRARANGPEPFTIRRTRNLLAKAILDHAARGAGVQRMKTHAILAVTGTARGTLASSQRFLPRPAERQCANGQGWNKACAQRHRASPQERA